MPIFPKRRKESEAQPTLAIALSVKRKKKATGGSVQSGSKDMNYAKGGNVNAKNERRPMPNDRHDDAKMVSRNSGDKPAHDDSWTDKSTVRQAQAKDSRKVMPIKHPKMVPSNAFSVRMRDQEDHLEESASPGPYGKQPSEHDNEEGPDHDGPSVPALKMKKMAEGGSINEEVSFDDSEEDRVQHPEGLESDDDMMGPPEEEFMADHFAEGGDVEHDEDEMMLDHAASIAAAIMAKRDRKAMAEGGSINGEDSIYSDDSDQADLKRNAEEDANMEDQSSYDALRKENYSESEGLEQLDSPMESAQHGDPREDEEENDHDKSVVGSIRRKMKSKSPISR